MVNIRVDFGCLVVGESEVIQCCTVDLTVVRRCVCLGEVRELELENFGLLSLRR